MREIIDSIAAFWASVPSPVAALVALVLGWTAAFLSKALVTGLLRLVKADRLAERTGFADFLKKGNVRYETSALCGVLAYWVVLILSLIRIAAILDPTAIGSLVQKATGLLPGIAAAVFIVIVGFLLVSFVSNFARTIARNAAVPNASLFAKGIRYLGNILVAVMALDQLGLGTGIVSSLLLVAFGALALGLALAFGLGCKDLAREAALRILRALAERERDGKGGDLEG